MDELDGSCNSDDNIQTPDNCEEYQNPNPWPNLEELFTFVLKQKKIWHFKCKDGKILTYDQFVRFVERIYGSYGPYELKMASRIVRTVRFVKRIYGSWMQLFNRWKSQFVTKWSLEKFVDLYGSYGPYELKMASRIVRTVRFVKNIYGSWIKFTNRWKSQFVIRLLLKNSSIRRDRTDHTNWKWLHRSYEPYGSWKGSRIANTAFQSVKESVCDLVKLGIIRRSARIVRTVRTENGFTDRANRTVREKDLRIVKHSFQSVKESVCDLVKLGKIRRSVRIGSWTGFTDREYSFSIGERVSCWLSEAWKNSSIRTDRTDRTNWKWLHGSWKFVSRFSHLARSSHMASYINSVSFLSKKIFVLRTVGDGFLVMKSVILWDVL